MHHARVAPSALDSTLLAQRLRELAAEERNVQVEFLLHLGEFDRRRAAPQRQRQRKADREPRPSAEPAVPTSRIPATVRREVWTRDGGRCAWVGPDGRRCNSRWQLELDHIQPQALGGPSTLDNLRLACKPHNLLHAERTYGRDHMDRFRRVGVAGRTRDAGAATLAPQQALRGP